MTFKRSCLIFSPFKLTDIKTNIIGIFLCIQANYELLMCTMPSTQYQFDNIIFMERDFYQKIPLLIT